LLINKFASIIVRLFEEAHLLRISLGKPKATPALTENSDFVHFPILATALYSNIKRY